MRNFGYLPIETPPAQLWNSDCQSRIRWHVMNLQQTPAIGFCRQCLQNPDTQVIQMSVVK